MNNHDDRGLLLGVPTIATALLQVGMRLSSTLTADEVCMPRASCSLFSKLFIAISTLTLLSTASKAALTTVSYPTLSPTPSDLWDLDHHSLYTWKISDVNIPTGMTVSSATLTIRNIENWRDEPNKLFIHLLDTAKWSGVRSFVDDPTPNDDDVAIRDDFVDPRFHSQSSWLVRSGTQDTLLDAPSFSTNPTTYRYSLSAAELAALNSYIANGKDFALGFDPDCHFFNDGITFDMKLSPVPEPSTAFIYGGGFLAVLFFLRGPRKPRGTTV